MIVKEITILCPGFASLFWSQAGSKMEAQNIAQHRKAKQREGGFTAACAPSFFPMKEEIKNKP